MRPFAIALMLFVFAAGAAAQAPSTGAGQGASTGAGYPAKPIRLIVPYTPGGDTDVVARLVAPKLSEAVKQPVIVDNRPGAGSLIGTEAMLRAPADGYTLAMGTISSLAVLPVTKVNAPYDPLKDIAPIVLLTVVPYVLHVHPSIPARSVNELVKLAKSRPRQLSYGSPGIATGIHLATEYFATATGVSLVHVPYKGSAPLMIDFLAGNISLFFGTLSTTGQHLKTQRLRALAIAAPSRSKDFAQIPTMSEAGYRGFDASTWHGIVTRAGTPRPIVTRLNSDISRIVNGDEVRPALVNAGFDIGAGTAEDFERFVRSEIEKWKKVATVAKITLD